MTSPVAGLVTLASNIGLLFKKFGIWHFDLSPEPHEMTWF